MKNPLDSLKDIPSVEGSFVLNADGELVLNGMPPIFGDSMFEELGRRIQSMFMAMESQGHDFQEIQAKFSGFRIFTKRSPDHFLVILCEAGVNQPALKMAAAVTLKQLNTSLSEAPNGTPAVSPAAAPAPAPNQNPDRPRPRRLLGKNPLPNRARFPKAGDSTGASPSTKKPGRWDQRARSVGLLAELLLAAGCLLSSHFLAASQVLLTPSALFDLIALLSHGFCLFTSGLN